MQAHGAVDLAVKAACACARTPPPQTHIDMHTPAARGAPAPTGCATAADHSVQQPFAAGPVGCKGKV